MNDDKCIAYLERSKIISSRVAVALSVHTTALSHTLLATDMYGRLVSNDNTRHCNKILVAKFYFRRIFYSFKQTAYV